MKIYFYSSTILDAFEGVNEENSKMAVQIMAQYAIACLHDKSMAEEAMRIVENREHASNLDKIFSKTDRVFSEGLVRKGGINSNPKTPRPPPPPAQR